MVYRVEAYTHNIAPSTTGGAMVRASVETDFAARNEAFVGFVKSVAMQAYIHSESNFKKLCEKEPALQEQYDEIVKKLAEKVEVGSIAVFTSPDQQAEMEREGRSVSSAMFE